MKINNCKYKYDGSIFMFYVCTSLLFQCTSNIFSEIIRTLYSYLLCGPVSGFVVV